MYMHDFPCMGKCSHGTKLFTDDLTDFTSLSKVAIHVLSKIRSTND